MRRRGPPHARDVRVEAVSDANSPKPPRRVRASVAPGVYLCCTSCGRMLRIVWATRSIVCSCGARLTPPKREKGGQQDGASDRGGDDPGGSSRRDALS